MTVRLLVPFNGLPAGATVTGGDENWLIATGRAFALNRLRLLVPYNGLPAGAVIGPNADATYLVSAGIAVAVGAANPLRIVGAGGLIPNAIASSQYTKSRMPIIIGADCSELSLPFDNWIVFNGEVTAGLSPYTINKAYLEKASPAAGVPVTFDGGSRSKTLAVGDSAVFSDVILPSAFGLTKFTKGEIYWLRIIQTIADGSVAAGHAVGQYVNYPSSRAQKLTSYDDSDIDTTGVMALTGTTMAQALTYSGVIGRFVAATGQVSLFSQGDSICDGVGDGVGGIWVGRGPMARASGSINAVSNFPFMQASHTGDTNWAYLPAANTRIRKYWAFANAFGDEQGTNEALNTGAVMYSKTAQLWDQVKLPGSIKRILRWKLLPRVGPVGNPTGVVNPVALDGSDQQAHPSWVSGANVDQFHDLLTTALANGLIDAFPDTRTPVMMAGTGTGGTDAKWKTNGAINYMTSDGTHPYISTGNQPIADALRPAVIGLNMTGIA